MRNLKPVKTIALAFEDFHPRLWVLAFIALVFISIAWLAFTRPPPIRPSIYALFSSTGVEEEDPKPPPGERKPLFTAGLRDTLPDEVGIEIGDCVRTVNADVDGDGRRERVCVRIACYRSQTGQTLYDSLIVDIFKHGDWLLRQELDRALFRQERFHLLRDLDMDGAAELVTLLSAGTEESGDEAWRIYKFDGYAFVEALHVFGLPPQDASVAFFLRHLPEIREEISARYMAETGSENLCGDSGEEADCFAGSPWLLDSNGDGRLELVQVLEPPDSEDTPKAGQSRLFVKEFRRRGTEGRSRFHTIGPASAVPKTGSILFHKSDDGRVVLLASFADPGAPSAQPATTAFEIAGTSVKIAAGIGAYAMHSPLGRLRLARNEGPLETRYVK
jgi:hypothetical protein